jgi:hypothetical protein
VTYGSKANPSLCFVLFSKLSITNKTSKTCFCICSNCAGVVRVYLEADLSVQSDSLLRYQRMVHETEVAIPPMSDIDKDKENIQIKATSPVTPLSKNANASNRSVFQRENIVRPQRARGQHWKNSPRFGWWHSVTLDAFKPRVLDKQSFVLKRCTTQTQAWIHLNRQRKMIRKGKNATQHEKKSMEYSCLASSRQVPSNSQFVDENKRACLFFFDACLQVSIKPQQKVDTC